MYKMACRHLKQDYILLLFIENALESPKGSSDQIFVPENPTKRIPFINHDTQKNGFQSNSKTHYLLQATLPNNQKHNSDPSTESSLDGLLKEYMESQKNKGGDGTITGDQMTVPHDARPVPVNSEQLGVPQDGANENLQQNIALLKKILHSKKIMKVGDNAMKGIDMAAAVNEPNTNDEELPNQLDLTQDELNHLAQSPDAIKLINDYMNRNMTKQVKPLTVSYQGTQGSQQANTKSANPSSSANKTVGTSGREEKPDTKVDGQQHSDQMSSTTTVTTRMPLPTMSTLGTTVKTKQKDLSKLIDPTAKLGGKVIGNMFYEQFLKPAQDDSEKQAKNGGEQSSESKAIGLLRKKVSALQAISDALMLITSKMNPDQAGGKRHHSGRNNNYRHGEGSKELQDLPDSVEPKDVQVLQDKINKAIETTEAMERQAAYKNPGLVALRLKGKVAQDVQAEARNRVEQRKERLRIDKQIKDIEDSFNMLIEKAEKTGKFSDVDVKNNPTVSLFQELQSGALKMPFNDGQLHGHDNDTSTKGVYGFEVVNQEPVINIINEKDNTAKSNTMHASSSSTTVDVPQTIPQTTNDPHNLLAATHLPNQVKEQSSVIQLAPKTTSKAANSIANALRRHSGNQNVSSVALKPITTFNNIQDVTLGGRINSEVIKEKEKEKLYHGKDVNVLLNMIKAPSSSTPNQAQIVSQNQVPGKDLHKPGKDDKVPEVQTVGTLDQNSVKLLSVLVQGFLDQRKNRRILKHRHHRKKKKEQHEDKDFVIGAKHDQMGTNRNNDPDRELLNALQNRLTSAQRYSFNIKNIVSDAQITEGEDDDTVKSVPTDKEKQTAKENSLVLSSPTAKPIPAPSDDPSLELVNKYTDESSLDKLLFSLQNMLKQGKVDIEEDTKKGISSAQQPTVENASKTSLSSKPHVVQFSGAATSGKIVGPGNEGKTTTNQDVQKITQFAGGRILEPANSAGMLPVRQDTISIINANPTTKSQVDAAAHQKHKPISKLKLKNLVSGVKLLLNALRGKKITSHKGRDWERLEDDTSDQDDEDEDHGDNENETHENLFKEKEKPVYNRFLDYGGTKSKDMGTWFVGEGNSYKTGQFQQPVKGYQYDEQYQMNLAQQYATTPNEYTTFTPDIYSNPYTSYALQPNTYGYSPKKLFHDPFDKQYTSKLPNPAKHALNSALKNDPIIQAVEEFSNNESQLYDEKLRGIQKDNIPQQQPKYNH